MASALTPEAKPTLLAFNREWQRETHDVLRDALKEVMEELQKLGVKVEGLITDNAANLQLALSQLKEEHGLVTLPSLGRERLTLANLFKELCVKINF